MGLGYAIWTDAFDNAEFGCGCGLALGLAIKGFAAVNSLAKDGIDGVGRGLREGRRGDEQQKQQDAHRSGH